MTTVTIGQGAGVTYAGENDTNLIENTPTSTNDSATAMFVYSAVAGQRRRALMLFSGLSNISPSVSATSVTLQLRNALTTSNVTLNVHRILVPWTASQACWNLRSTGNSWTSNGGLNSTDVDMTPIATVSVLTSTDFYSITGNSALNALVEGWINGTIPNYGVMIVRDTDTAYDGVLTQINGGLAATAVSRPLMTVTYTAVVPPTVSTNPDVSVVEGVTAIHTVTLSGTTAAPTALSVTIVGSGANPATGGGTDFVSDLSAITYGPSGVTYSGGVLTVPAGVLNFPIEVPTTANTTDNADKFYTLTVGGVPSVCTITDDDATPALLIPGPVTVDSGDSVVASYTLGAVSGRVTYARLVLTDGTAVGGTDYTNIITDPMLSDGVTISAGVLSIPAGVAGFTITIPTAA